MPFDFKVEKHIPTPHVLPIVGFPRVLDAPNLTLTIVPSTFPCLPMKLIIIEILFIPPLKLDFQRNPKVGIFFVSSIGQMKQIKT